MKTKLLSLLLLSMTIIVGTSCSKDVLFETENVSNANSVLKIRTRAASDGTTDGTKVSYPVNIYVFDGDKKCVSVSVMESEEKMLSVSLKEGTYSVYAIAGAGSDYELPTQENATETSVVALKSETDSDLMAAHNTVVLTDGGENTLTLSLSRKVMLLQSVEISNVPSAMQSVSVTIAPLYKNLCLDGSYSTTTEAKTVTLTKVEGAKTWKNENEIYLLEANGTATITVNMQNGDGTAKSYSYTSADELKANYKIKIKGTYTDKVGVTMTGTLTGTEWAGDREITFDFDEAGSTETDPEETVPGGGETGDEDVSAVPEVGTVYKGCYVLSSESTAGAKTVTLMSLKHLVHEFVGTETQEDIKKVADDVIGELTAGVDGSITGWRLPTETELKYVKSNLDAIVENLRKIPNTSTYDIFTTTQTCLYGYDSSVKALSLANGYTVDIKGKNHIRAITTIEF